MTGHAIQLTEQQFALIDRFIRHLGKTGVDWIGLGRVQPDERGQQKAIAPIKAAQQKRINAAKTLTNSHLVCGSLSEEFD